MMKMLMFFMISLSYIFSINKHPLSAGLIILLQTFNVCIFSRLVFNSSWISLTLFLVMVGGLMIIFIYMTSICSNQVFSKLKWNQILVNLLVMIPIYHMIPQKISLNLFMVNLNLTNKEYLKMFMPLNIQTSLFSFFYLILMLLFIIKMTSMNKGPLRKKY